MEAVADGGRVKNRLLGALPGAEYERLLPHLDEVTLPAGRTIYHHEEPIRSVYFPTDAVIAVLSATADGGTAEVAMAGCRGMAGVRAVLSTSATPFKAAALIPGGALRLRADILKAEFDGRAAFRDLLLRYVQTLLTESRQLTLCSNLHPLVGRLCRWLLTVRDCAETDGLPLTHELVSQMLGVRREGVTLAVNRLQADGALLNPRGALVVADRGKLEAAACECYRMIKDEYDRLLAA
jgi:CRP-like cAMP-binding protein